MADLHDAAVKAVAKARSPKPGGSELAGRIAVAAIANDPNVREAMVTIVRDTQTAWRVHNDRASYEGRAMADDLADAILQSLGGNT